ncbi:MAG: hypothetical protein ACYSWR_06090, partial [Planctomycetota bacterium]
MNYGSEVEEELERIEAIVIDKKPQMTAEYGSRWLAIKLLEQDPDITAKVQNKEVLDVVTASVEHLKDIFADAP